MLVRLSSKGRLVIPKTIREALGLRTGTEFEVDLKEGKIVLEPLEVKTSPVEALYGKYPDDNFLAELETEHKREITDEAALRT